MQTISFQRAYFQQGLWARWLPRRLAHHCSQLKLGRNTVHHHPPLLLPPPRFPTRRLLLIFSPSRWIRLMVLRILRRIIRLEAYLGYGEEISHRGGRTKSPRPL